MRAPAFLHLVAHVRQEHGVEGLARAARGAVLETVQAGLWRKGHHRIDADGDELAHEGGPHLHQLRTAAGEQA